MSAPSSGGIAPPEPASLLRPGKPAWMRQPLFRFLSSVNLAVVLLAVLIVASIVGTLYETSFDAKVARAYIYNAWWFDLWLTVLCVNLACAAFSRWPWKRHHTGFLITHLGIIILLVGAMIGRGWGIEGTMRLFRGQPPNNVLVVDERVLRVEENNGHGEIRQYPVEIIGRHPTPARPWKLGKTAQGWDLALVDYAPALDASFEPQPVPAEMAAVGQPAVRVKLVSKRLRQSMDQWLLAGDPEHAALDLGLASVQVRRGSAPASPASAAPAAVPAATPAGDAVDERIIAFALMPGQQVAQPAPGTAPSGVKVRLQADPASPDGKKEVLVDWQGATWSLDPDAARGRDEELGGSGLSVTVENYWPNFVFKDNLPGDTSDTPRGPAVLVRVHGRLPAAAAAAADDTAAFGGAGKPGGAAPNIGTAADNQAVVYCDDAGKLTFTLKSSALRELLTGTLEPGHPVNTGWADWQLEAVQTLPGAVAHTVFRVVKNAPPRTGDQAATSGDPNVVGKGDGGGNNPGRGTPDAERMEGVRVRLSRDGVVHEQWAADRWQITLPTTPLPTRLAYGPRLEMLPVGVQLDRFEVTFNEGTTDPASFKSNLRVTDVEGAIGTGSCSMNQPFNFPGHWWNTFSGLTYKMSQASWSGDPRDLDMSVVQILRDPGWLFKWIGSLLVCAGIFALFYLRPARGAGARAPTPVLAVKK